MRRDAEGCAAPLAATVLPVPLQKPKTVSRGGSGPAGRREREKNAVERASIAADHAEDGGTFHPGHHSNIRASSAISRVQGEVRQAAAWLRPAVPGTERRGDLPCTMEKLRSAVLERQKRSEFEFGVVDQFLHSAVSLATTRCVLLAAD